MSSAAPSSFARTKQRGRGRARKDGATPKKSTPSEKSPPSEETNISSAKYVKKAPGGCEPWDYTDRAVLTNFGDDDVAYDRFPFETPNVDDFDWIKTTPNFVVSSGAKLVKSTSYNIEIVDDESVESVSFRTTMTSCAVRSSSSSSSPSHDFILCDGSAVLCCEWCPIDAENEITDQYLAVSSVDRKGGELSQPTPYVTLWKIAANGNDPPVASLLLSANFGDIESTSTSTTTTTTTTVYPPKTVVDLQWKPPRSAAESEESEHRKNLGILALTHWDGTVAILCVPLIEEVINATKDVKGLGKRSLHYAVSVEPIATFVSPQERFTCCSWLRDPTTSTLLMGTHNGSVIICRLEAAAEEKGPKKRIMKVMNQLENVKRGIPVRSMKECPSDRNLWAIAGGDSSLSIVALDSPYASDTMVEIKNSAGSMNCVAWEMGLPLAWSGEGGMGWVEWMSGDSKTFSTTDTMCAFAVSASWRSQKLYFVDIEGRVICVNFGSPFDINNVMADEEFPCEWMKPGRMSSPSYFLVDRFTVSTITPVSGSMMKNVRNVKKWTGFSQGFKIPTEEFQRLMRSTKKKMGDKVGDRGNRFELQPEFDQALTTISQNPNDQFGDWIAYGSETGLVRVRRV